VNTSEAFELYLTRVLVLQPVPSGTQVIVPRNPRRIQTGDLERALNDPHALSLDQDEPATQLCALVHFALWLGDCPPEYVPRKLASRAARFRFAVWSLPLRMGWPPEWRSLRVSWSAVDPPRPDDDVPVSEELVLAEARAARDDWLAQLNNWEDDYWLAARHERDPGLLEAELWWLTTTWPRPPRRKPLWPGRPRYLDLDLEGPDGGRDRSSYRRVATDLAELHWLPRGSLRSASAALFPRHPAVRLVPWLFPLAALVAVGLFVSTLWWATGWLVPAAVGVAVGLMVVGIGVAGVVPSRLSVLGLLRIPAAVAVGQVVLLSLTPRWWLASSGWRVGAGLLVIAALYLVLESRLHGTGWRWAYPRGLVIAGIAACYAFALSLIVLTFVAPSVAERGECLHGWWSDDPWSARTLESMCTEPNDGPAAAPAGALLLMTGWSLAVGLAAQILWDDRPVTAPLGRLRRVRGVSP
jgi:hypothetical protein